MSWSSPTPPIITACALTKAAGEGSGDAAAGVALLARHTTVEVPEGAALQVLGAQALRQPVTPTGGPSTVESSGRTLIRQT
jgi:hypothetical protein